MDEKLKANDAVREQINEVLSQHLTRLEEISGYTADEAKAKVLEKVPYATVDNIQEFEADFDDGRKEYEGKLVYGKMECEFAIDAKTGEFRDWDVDNFSDCIRCN